MIERTAASGGPHRPSRILFAWALRIALLAGAGAALSLALFDRPPAERRVATFVCPMHPQIRSPIAGRCPICAMALVAEERAGAPSGGDGPGIAPGDLHTVRSYLFSTPTRAPAWIDPDGTVVALLYRDEAEGLEVGARATFSAALAPEAAVPVTLENVPPRAWDAETLQLRFRFEGTAAARPGEVGRVALTRPRRPLLAVEEDMVFTDEGGRRYVLVPTRDARSYERRPIEIGRVINGRAVVVAGLAEGERIVRRRAFFLDADLRVREASAAGTSPP